MSYKINVYVDPDRAVRKHRATVEVDPKSRSARVERMRNAVHICMQRGLIPRETRKQRNGMGARRGEGVMVRLAEHFNVTRQRIYQLVRDERARAG